MKKFLPIAMAFALLLISPVAYAQAGQATEIPPPVEPPLVREGDFAIKLVSALELGTVENEVEAEAMLASAGIAPKNGWISDYPVTPDIIGELKVALAAAADAEKLLLGKDKALEALEMVAAELGLFVLAETSEDDAETQPPTSPRYIEPTVVNNYYNTHGPPVVTYYPPPPAYGYLYAWVPYPFWCAGFSFRGFFILHDFHRVSIIHPRVVVVTNHVFHRHHRRFFRVDPVKRGARKSRMALVGRPGRRGFATAEARRGARSILERSRDRMRSGRGPTARTAVTAKSGNSSPGRIRATRRPAATSEARRRNRSISQRSRDRTMSSTRPRAVNSVTAKPDHSAAGRIRLERGRNTPASSGPNGERTHIASQKNFKAVPKGSGGFFRIPGGSEWQSSRPSSRRSRGSSGDFRGDSRGFSRKFPGWRPCPQRCR
jgi:hypothetical protein